MTKINSQNTTHKTYGYIRVSTGTQAEKGYGLTTQKDAIRDYCKKQNIELSLPPFVDAAKHGTISCTDDVSNRPALVKLISLLQPNDTVIVMNTSRLWRDDAAKVFIYQKFRKLTVEIKSIEQPRYSLYSKDPNDFFFNSIVELLDNYERMKINFSLAKGRTTKAKHGYKPAGNAPYGYKWNKATNLVEVDKDESSIVVHIFELAAQGMTPSQIANFFNERGFTTRRGNEWSRQGIRVILRNKFYIGIVTHDRREIPGKHTPLIDSITFNAAKKVC